MAAQTLDDFESGDRGWQPVNEGWVDFEIVGNPAPDAVNASANVLKVVRHAGTENWAGVILRDNLTLTFGTLEGQYRYAKIKFLKPTAGEVTLKLENNGDAGSFSANGNCTAAGAWQEVTIDLGAAGGSYNDFFIQPEKTAALAADATVYIDDIRFETDPNAAEHPDPEIAGEFALVWADEFNGTGYDSEIWSPQIAGDGFGNNELQYYTGNANNIFTRDGCLVLKAINENYQNREYTSGKLWSQGKKFFKYGRVEARFRLPAGRGTWPAIWMMPQSSVYGGWPNSGEIDIMEFVGYEPNRIYGTVHRQAGSGSNGDGNNIFVAAPDDFHVIRIDWEPGYIKWYLDEVLFHTYNNAYTGSAQYPFDQNFYVILNFAIGGNWGGAQGVDNSIFPQEFLIDYVRVYQKSPTAVENLQTSDFSVIRTDTETLTVSAENEFSLVIYSLSGKKLYEQNHIYKKINLNIAPIAEKMFIVNLSDSVRSYSEKILK